MSEDRSGGAVPREPGLQLFLAIARRYPPLTNAEEGELLRRLRRGDRESLDHLVNAHLRLVARIAREHFGRGLSCMDLVAEGLLGLIRAARQIDERYFREFPLLAEEHIRRQIARAVAESGATGRAEAARG